MPNIPLLVISCDRYADLWRPFFTVFFRQWPECPFPVHLGTNTGAYDDARVTTIRIGDDLSWASGVLSMLDALRSEHVILFLEDFLILEPVDDAAVRRFVATAQRTAPASVRFSPLPPPSRLPSQPFDPDPELGYVDPGTPYRVSAQPAIWRTDVLRRLLVPGFSAWQFEQIGSQMSDRFSEPFLGPFKPAVVYDHAIEKGKWKPEGLRIARRLGVEVDLSVRGAFDEAELAAHVISGVRANETYQLKAEAMAAFAEGRRRAGLRAAARYVRNGGSLAHSLAIAACGIAGPRAIEALRQWNISMKIRRARATFARRLARQN